MYTVTQAAQELGLDSSHVRFLIRSGKLKGVKWGRDWMIPTLDYRRKQGLKRSVQKAPPNFRSQAAAGNSNILPILKETPILKSVSLRELTGLAKSCILLHFNKHQTIVMEEDKAESCYIIVNGLLKMTKTSSSGRELIIDILGRGSVFGIGSLIPGYVRPDGVYAVENTDIVLIPRNIFMAFASRNPAVLNRIIELLLGRIANLYARLIDLLTYKTNHRVIKILNELRNNFGDSLPLTHKEIAEFSGTTNETATRVLVNLKKQGALELQRGHIQVTDAKKLLL
jgi:CRP/FNR family transcriptional regulator, cyclic AMP receptor protein